MFNGYRRTTRDYRAITDHIHQIICKKSSCIILMFFFQTKIYPELFVLKLYLKLHTHTKTILLDLK